VNSKFGRFWNSDRPDTVGFRRISENLADFFNPGCGHS
jgi:hypothetical protein